MSVLQLGTVPAPLTIPGCKSWIDATDVSTITESANRISSIRNKANSAVPATQSTGSAQPGTGVSTISGFNAIRFDNDNERFLLTNLGATMTNMTFFAVVQKFVSGGLGHVIAGGGSNQSIRLNSANTGFSSNDGTTSLTIAPGPSMVTTPAIIALTCDAVGLTRSVYMNSPTAILSGQSYDGSIGSQWFGATSSVAGNGRGGHDLAESGIYDRVLSTAELIFLFRYFSNKFGIALT